MDIFAIQARLPTGWAENVRVSIKGGRIAGITPGQSPAATDHRVGILVPALSNVHSHAFQRAMAGMAEHRRSGQDSFWTWRSLMYRFLDHLTPDHVATIAALVQMEMLEAGYAAIGEFHYLHHQPGGAAYDNLAELSEKIFAAARITGIGLTHLPVFYQYGGVGKQPLSGGQKRFGTDLDQFSHLMDQVQNICASAPPDTRVGIAPHSLRAVAPQDLPRLLAAHPDGPVHIHIAEQVQEVSEIVTALGARPVEWLLVNAPVDRRWCLIHATHMTKAETTGLATRQAVAGLCPITEANLGDGVFNGPGFLTAGGTFGIGSDSNVRISLTEELRMLEYSQRLRDRGRNILVDRTGSLGATLYLGAARGGAQALNRDAGAIQVGKLADLTALDGSDPTLMALEQDQILDGFCVAAGDNLVKDVWSAGRHVVQDGHHIKRQEIIGQYRKGMADLLDRI